MSKMSFNSSTIWLFEIASRWDSEWWRLASVASTRVKHLARFNGGGGDDDGDDGIIKNIDASVKHLATATTHMHHYHDHMYPHNHPTPHVSSSLLLLLTLQASHHAQHALSPAHTY
jgi:hypothetical protein